MRLRRKSWARLIARVYLENPTLCTSCGKEMKIISALTSPHQDGVIERILRARNEWNPPWLANRMPRGPPRNQDEGFGPGQEEESYLIDDLPPDVEEYPDQDLDSSAADREI